MKYNVYNKVTSPKAQYCKSKVSYFHKKKQCKKISKVSVNTVITSNYNI